MARISVLDDLRSVVSLEVPEKPLIVPIMDPLAVRLAEATYGEYSTDAATVARVWSNAIERFDLDWAGIFIDDLFEFEPLGIDVTGTADLPFAVRTYLPANRSTQNALRVPNPKRDGRMPMLLEAESRLRDEWGNSILVCGSTAAPFTALTLTYGIEQVMLMLSDDPDFLRESMLFMEELVSTWGRAMIDGGADVIWLGDCSASSRFIPLSVYKELCLEPAKRVVACLREAGATVIYHAGENKISYLDATVRTEADIISVESGVEIGEVQEAIGDKVALTGNLDSINLIWQGTPESIRSVVESVVSQVAVNGGYIVNVGENTPEQTPVANLQAMIDSIRESWPARRATTV